MKKRLSPYILNTVFGLLVLILVVVFGVMQYLQVKNTPKQAVARKNVSDAVVTEMKKPDSLFLKVGDWGQLGAESSNRESLKAEELGKTDIGKYN